MSDQNDADQNYLKPALYIDGSWRVSDGAGGEAVINPATGAVLGQLPWASEAQIAEALAAAARGFARWRAEPLPQRAALMARAAQILRAGAEAAAIDMTLEQGKPLAEARAEIESCAALLEYMPREAAAISDRVLPERAGYRDLRVRYEPVGPVLALSPWNFPASLATRKLASVLAAGCSVIVKPANETPVSVAHVIRALDQAGIPPGVVQLLHGDSPALVARLVADPVIRKVAFTGSTRVGCLIAAQCGAVAKPSVMELGGHAPVIIAEDADTELALQLSALSKFRNAGQVCVSPTRWLVHESHHHAFARGMAAAAQAIVTGDGLDPATTMGPMATARGPEAIDALVRDAVAKGAELLAGGHRLNRPGHFYAPTVLAHVPDTAAILQTEPFGPVAVINAVTSLEEALSQANNTDFALGAYAFTGSPATAEAIAAGLDAGMVGVNSFVITHPDSPIGGRRASGFGSEGGPEGLRAYLIPKFTVFA